MSIIREKIRFNNSLVALSGGTTGTTGFTGTTMNLRISLSSSDNLIEYQQEIDRLTQFTTIDLINPVVDGEERRFKLNPTPSANITLNFQFYNVTASTYQTLLTAAGFTANEINNNTLNVLNSFFILDFYDTFDINSQTKIFTTYLTKLNKVPSYTIGASNNNQFYRWYVPLSYLQAETGSTITGYVKFSFYNAKTGKVITFFNNDNISLTTPEYMFFKAELYKNGMTWKFLTSSYPTITAKEIINNTLFANKVNNTVENKDDLKQNPPSGTTYDYKTNTYFIS